MTDPVARYYDTYWRPEGFNPRGVTDPAIESLLAQITSEGDVVVEVGCADGRKSGVWLHAHQRQYEGLDIASSAVDAARSNGLLARVVTDAAETELPSGSVDCVVCTDVLEHLFAPHEAAKEAWRALRVGGRYLVTVPNVGFWRRRVDMVFGRWNPLGDGESVASALARPAHQVLHRLDAAPDARRGGLRDRRGVGLRRRCHLSPTPVVPTQGGGEPAVRRRRAPSSFRASLSARRDRHQVTRGISC